MASINLHDRALEVHSTFTGLYGKIKLEQAGEPDIAAHIMPIIDRLSAAFAAKYTKEKSTEFPERLADEVLLTDAYIYALNFAGVFSLIIDNKKPVGKKGTTIAANALDAINTLSKIGKGNAAISDHYLISSALNQIISYADRNNLEIEDVYQEKLARIRGTSAPVALAS